MKAAHNPKPLLVKHPKAPYQVDVCYLVELLDSLGDDPIATPDAAAESVLDILAFITTQCDLHDADTDRLRTACTKLFQLRNAFRKTRVYS